MSVQTERSSFRNLVVVAAGVLGAATLALSLTVWWLRTDAIDDASKNAAKLGSGLIDYSQKMTMAAMQIADMNV